MYQEQMQGPEQQSMIDFSMCGSVQEIYARINRMEADKQELVSPSGNYPASELLLRVKAAVKLYNENKSEFFSKNSINFVPSGGQLRDTLYKQLTGGFAIIDDVPFTASDRERANEMKNQFN